MKNKTRIGALAPVGIIGSKEDPIKYLQRMLPGIRVGSYKLFEDIYYTFSCKRDTDSLEMLSTLPLDSIVNSVKSALNL